jgi:hypothetical protein
MHFASTKSIRLREEEKSIRRTGGTDSPVRCAVRLLPTEALSPAIGHGWPTARLLTPGTCATNT